MSFALALGAVCVLLVLCIPRLRAEAWRDAAKHPLFWLVAYILLQLLLVDVVSQSSKTFSVVAQLALSGAVFWIMPRFPGAAAFFFLRWFAMALVVVYGVTLVEALADFPLYRLLTGKTGAIGLHQLKWIETIAFMFTLPVLYGCVREKSRGFAAALVFSLAAVLCVSITQSVHMALVVAIIVFPLGQFYGRRLWMVSMAGLLVLALAMPFASQYIFRNYAGTINEMPFIGLRDGNGAHRLEIYDAVAAKIMERPWRGYGVDAARHITDFPIEKRFYHTTFIYHPHNCLLQFWLDLGLAGMCIALAVVAWVFRAISRVEDRLCRSFALSTACAGFSIALVGYGVWQSWWIATLTLTGALFLLLSGKQAPQPGA